MYAEVNDFLMYLFGGALGLQFDRTVGKNKDQH
jgi:hypothetical protein